MVQGIIFSIFFIQKQFMKWNANFSYCTTQLDRKLKIQASWWCYLNRTSPKETFHCYTPSMAPAGRMLWQSWSYCVLSSHRKFQRSPTDSKKIHIQDEMMRSTDICTCPKEPQLTMYNTCCLGSSLGSLGWQSYPRAGLSGSNKILSVKKNRDILLSNNTICNNITDAHSSFIRLPFSSPSPKRCRLWRMLLQTPNTKQRRGRVLVITECGHEKWFSIQCVSFSYK